MKKCKKFLKLISGQIDGVLSKKEEELLKSHLNECESCRKAKEEMEKISKDLKSIDVLPPEKSRIKIKRSELLKTYQFQISNFFPLLFALIFFILVFILWQNLKEKGYPFCLEVRENVSDKFPKMIERIYIEKEVPKDFYILLELNLEEGKKKIKLIETNYSFYSSYFLNKLKEIKLENFENKIYYLKIYKCP